MRPRWKKIKEENPWLQTEYFDFDTDIEKISKYNLKAQKLPTFIFLDNKNVEIERMREEIEEKDLLRAINQYKNM